MGAGGTARPILTSSSLLSSARPPLSFSLLRPQAGGGAGWATPLPSPVSSSPFPTSLSISPWLHAGLAGGCPAHQAVFSLGRLAGGHFFCTSQLCKPSVFFPALLPRGAIGGACPCAEKHPSLCRRGRPYQPNRSGRLSSGGGAMLNLRAESGLDCALRLSPIIKRQKPAKTPKYFFLGLLWVI